MNISNSLKKQLIFLADSYENANFLKDDPSFFMHQYNDPDEKELAAFIASSLSLGQRNQIIAKTKFLLTKADFSLKKWIVKKSYEKYFPDTQLKYYRFFSYADIRLLLNQLNIILLKYGTLGNAVQTKYLLVCNTQKKTPLCIQQNLLLAISSLFPQCRLIPQTQKSCCKRLNMFLRWTVRKNSPVDLGLWTWYSASDLLIPLDTHVLKEAKRLKLLSESATNSFTTAITLTNEMKQIWPKDPCRADFALFGLGVNSQKSRISTNT